MKRTIWFVSWTWILITFLSACSPARDEFDRIFIFPPTAAADHTTASVGEQVEVTLTTTFEMFGQSRVQQLTVTEIGLGACFGNDVVQNSLVDAQGYCNPKQEDKSPPTWVEIVNGTSHMTNIESIIVKRGRKKTIEHTFSFTRTTPGEVVIGPNITYTPEGETFDYLPGIYRHITFE